MNDWWRQNPGHSTESQSPMAPSSAAGSDGTHGQTSASGIGALGANTIAVGVAAGVLAPIVGLGVSTIVIERFLADHPSLHLGVRTVAVALLLGAVLAGWSALTGGQTRVGLRKGLVAGVATAVVASALLPIADLLWRASRSEGGPGSLLVLVGAWTLIGGLAGAVAGIDDGLARSRNGLIGGLAGGLIGGILFAASSGDFRFTEEATVGSQLAGYGATSLGIGLGVGLTERLSRTAWLVAVDGPKAGREYILYRQATRIGRADDCEVYLGPDAEVATRHAEIRSTGNEIEFHPVDGAVEVDGQPWTGGPIAAGSVIRVGASFLRLEQR